jgi:large subunit ribosomal protein L25
MEQIELQGTTREILGKKVRFLRREGITPVHLFGHDIESVALQCDTSELKRILAQAGKARLISLRLDKAEKPRKVVVRQIQRDPPTGELLHVDFYQVIMAEKMKVEIPIVLVGEAPALKSKENMLMQEMSNLTIECLPDEIPPSIELDISHLTESEQTIQVRDIKLGEGITVLDGPEHIVVKIGFLSVEKVEKVEKVAEEEVGKAAEAAPSPEEERKEK